MFFTVADCLKLPSLRDCSVVAGKSGLNHIVNGATVLENYDSSFMEMAQPINNSELILTSFSSIRHDLEKQCEHIERMYRAGDAAVIIYYAGVYLEEIHPRLIETADRLGFPILMMPKNDLNRFYNEVLREIYETLSLNQTQKNQLVDNIASLVSRLPENRKNIHTLLRLISDNLKCTVLLTDTDTSNISISKWPAGNAITAETICSLYHKEANDENYLAETELHGISLRIFRMPLTALEYRNLTVYAADEFGTLTLNDMYNIADVLQLFSRLWDINPKTILESALLSAIIEGDSRKTKQAAAKLNIDMQTIHNVLFFYPAFRNMKATEQMQTLHAMIKQIKQCAEAVRKKVLVSVYDTYIVCFFVGTDAQDVEQAFYDELFREAGRIYGDYVYSIFPVNGSIENILMVYQIFDEYLHHAMVIFPEKKELSYGDLLFAKQCHAVMQSSEDSDLLRKTIIEPLTKAGGNDDLLKTLEVYYLDASCEIKKTSQMLYVHRNTIPYRLNKIRSITGLHPGNLTSSWLLNITVACHRLAQSQSEA